MGNEEELLRKEDLQKKKQWISQKQFKSYFGKQTTNNKHHYIQNYVSADPSDPPMLHRFRETNKEQWIQGNFKFWTIYTQSLSLGVGGPK